MAGGRNGSKGVTPGRAYRAYRFPHRKGGRLSRRYASAGARVGTFAGALTALILGFGLFLGGSAAAVVGYFAADLPAAHALETVQIPLSTYIYDRTGQHVLFRLEDERRIPITLGAVPERLQQATTAIEDRSFWTNPGIDVGGILRAAQANLSSGGIAQGGSTITQQLIKTRLLGDEPTLARKIKEAILALEATRTFPKEKILEMYFNQIYYGNQAYGIRAAAFTYFGVNDLNDLTLAQTAMLAGLPQLPSEYDPVQNPAGATARRAAVLDAMVENEYITEAEAAIARAEKIEVKPATTSIYAPHFTFRVREQIIQVLGEKAAYRGGYRIFTTLDRNMQELAEKEVREHVDALKRGSNVNNAALITMDPRTGEVRFSTNTFPEWPLAHPYRYVAHNGEINTVKGNYNWMKAREGVMSSPVLGADLKKLYPISFAGQSDTATFDNCLELLTMAGYPISQAVMMMIPEPWEQHTTMDERRKAFYEYHAAMLEPWDGPASIVFTDGRQIGATLDRNGLRPSRYCVTDDDLVIMASESGVLPIPENKIVRKWRLQPGKMFLIDLEQGRMIDDEELKASLANNKPYKQWIENLRIKLDDLSDTSGSVAESDVDLLDRKQAFGYTQEDI